MASTMDSQVSFDTLTDLRGQVGQANVIAYLNGLSTINDGNGGTYYWSATSTASDDGFTVVAVTGVTTGRWIRQLNPNTIKATVTLSGTGVQTSFTVAYPVTLPIIPASIQTEAYSANAAVARWVNNVTTTGFTLNFATAPILGTQNLIVNYIIIKQ